MSFLYRDCTELLEDSMVTVQEFFSKKDLIEYLQTDREWIGKYDFSKITIEKYGSGIDKRIGWDTYIVHLDGYGVLGFTNGKVE